jgi:hypothetical protein
MEDRNEDKKKDPIGCLGIVLVAIIGIIYAALTFGIFAP